MDPPKSTNLCRYLISLKRILYTASYFSLDKTLTVQWILIYPNVNFYSRRYRDGEIMIKVRIQGENIYIYTYDIYAVLEL